VPLFKDLETYAKLKLIDGLEIKNFKKGEFVIREDDQGEEFYIIEHGQCECLKTVNSSVEKYH